LYPLLFAFFPSLELDAPVLFHPDDHVIAGKDKYGRNEDALKERTN
jgi:hypothetical protein